MSIKFQRNLRFASEKTYFNSKTNLKPGFRYLKNGPISQKLREFHTDEAGVMTVFGTFLIIMTIVISGLAIDVANAMRLRTHLQVAADSAAHAALVVREQDTEANAKLAALAVARTSIPVSKFGDAIRADDIQFGFWDDTTQVFTPSAGATAAVLVNTQQMESRLNSVGTYFLRFAGFDNWNIVRQSVYETYIPTCMREGFVADEEIDVTSNNHYTAGFCIHSNSYVEVNNGNVLDSGVIVAMPDRRDLVVPANGFTQNTGLQESLRDGSYQMRIINRINEITSGVQDSTSPYYRSYITSATPVSISRNTKLDNAAWKEGRIHTVNCPGSNQAVQIPASTTLKRGVLVTNCEVKLGSNVALEDVTIVTTNTNDDSVNGASGIRFGKDDGCSAGGDAQIVTHGGVKLPASIEIYGSQILAAGDVEFTSNADGVEGASIIAGGHIYGTANSVIGFCNGAGMENNFEAWYFRMAA